MPFQQLPDMGHLATATAQQVLLLVQALPILFSDTNRADWTVDHQTFIHEMDRGNWRQKRLLHCITKLSSYISQMHKTSLTPADIRTMHEDIVDHHVTMTKVLNH